MLFGAEESALMCWSKAWGKKQTGCASLFSGSKSCDRSGVRDGTGLVEIELHETGEVGMQRSW